MSDILINLLDETCPESSLLFRRFKNKLFKDYSHGKNIIKKKDLWMPFNEITKELFNSNLDKASFNILYSDLDPSNKGFITKKQFNSVAKCLIMSLITECERKSPIPGREISICMENGELPVQMEIIDTLTDEEITQYKQKCKSKKRTKKYKRKCKKKNSIVIPTNNNDSKYMFIDIDSDSEDY